MSAPGGCDLSLILPAFNEAGSIAVTVSEAVRYLERRGLRYEIIVAADGNDGTREIVRGMAQQNPSIQAIGHIERCGKGRGVREAVARARGAIVGYADADNKVPIEEYEKIEPWFSEGYDIVIGSRAMGESRVLRPQPLYRRLGSKAFSFFMHTVIGLRGIADTQCGFKFFRNEVARELFGRQKIDGYMFDVEILLLATRLRYKIRQAPIRWRDDADSRYAVFSGSLRNAVDIFKIRFR